MYGRARTSHRSRSGCILARNSASSERGILLAHLPLHDDGNPSNARTAMNEAILVVYESRATLMLAEKTLSAAGYYVRVAYDARYAIELFEEFHPQLVLTDMLRAGEVDGIELVRRLRANTQAMQVAIVVATTEASEAERAGAMAAGCDDFISEPLTTEMLTRLVADRLAAKACGSEPLATVRNTSPG